MRYRSGLIAVLLALSLVAVACGGGQDTASEGAEAGQAEETQPAATSEQPAATEETAEATEQETGAAAESDPRLEVVPEALRPYYDGYWYFATVTDNPYADWTPPEPPWKFCYNDSYQGNDWRQAALTQYQKLVGEYTEAGLADGDLVVTNSDNDINVQLSQLNSLVQQGCNVIISIPSSPTGLCQGVDNAFEQGVLFITVESPVECEKAINVGFNEYRGGVTTAEWLAGAIGDKGSVVLVNGIPGLAPTQARRQGVLDVFSNYPDIEVIGEIDGMWTPSVAKEQMLKFLTTHPQEIDGVWNGALMGVAAAQAFEQAGRPLPKINGFSGSCSALAFWKETGFDTYYSMSQGGGPALFTGFDTAVRMLSGQKPVVNTILVPLPEITEENFDEWYDPSMTVESTCFSDPADGRRVSKEFMDQYFEGGEEPQLEPTP